MASFVPTASAVLQSTSAISEHVIAGAAINAGQLVYKDTTDSNEYKLADADAVASAVIAGIALNDAEDGQPLRVQTGGTVTIDAVATVGRVYTASTTAGSIATAGDAASGDFVSVFGVGITSTTIKIGIINSGVAVA